MMNRDDWRNVALVSAAITILTLLAVLIGCDPGDMRIVGTDPPPVVGQPGGPTDDPGGEPESETPPTTDTAEPDFLITETTTGDSLYVQAGATIGVGARGEVAGRMVIPANREYAVIVGMEGPICDLERADVIGIADDGTAGKSRMAVTTGSLVPADAFTSWFEDACTVVAWWVEGPRVYEFDVLIDGVASGESEIRTQFELVGHPSTNFRWVAFTGLEIVP